jgi:hypothetical protein
MRNSAVEVVLQPNTTFYLYLYSILLTLSLDYSYILQSTKAFMLGKAKSYILTNLQLLRVVYTNNYFTVLVKVTKLNT